MARTIKLILLGDAAVGKTTLRHKYLGKGTQKEYLPTIGADFAVKREKFDNQDYIIQIWDFAGQKHFLPLRRAYYKNTTCAFVLFDLTNYESFKNIPQWIEEMTSNLNKVIPFIILGNKVDLVEEKRIIPPSEVEEFVSDISSNYNFDIPYFVTSALYGENVDKVFNAILALVNEVGL